jgi:hypothetical protein
MEKTVFGTQQVARPVQVCINSIHLLLLFFLTYIQNFSVGKETCQKPVTPAYSPEDKPQFPGSRSSFTTKLEFVVPESFAWNSCLSSDGSAGDFN